MRIASDVHLFRGLVCLQNHDEEAGERELQSAVTIGREIQFEPVVVLALSALAMRAADRGELSVAEDLLRQAQRLAVLTQKPMLRMSLDAATGYVCRARGDEGGVAAAITRLRELAVQIEAENSPEYQQARAGLLGPDHG